MSVYINRTFMCGAHILQRAVVKSQICYTFVYGKHHSNPTNVGKCTNQLKMVIAYIFGVKF